MTERFKGSTSYSMFIELVDATTGLPKPAIVYSACTGSYVRTRSARTAITMATLTSATAAWSSGGFILVDDTNQPGVYRFDVPDAAFSSGVDEVVVTIKATGCRTVSRGFTLTDWNKQIASIPNAAAAASGGLPTVGTGSGQVNPSSGKIGATIAAGDMATDSLTGAAVKADAVTKIQAGLSTYNGSDTSGVTTLLTRVGTPSGASVSADVAAVKAETSSIVDDTNELQTDWVNGGRLDNILDSRSSSTEVTSIQNNTRVVRVVPMVIERPDSGTDTYRIELFLYDEAGDMEAPDSAPTIALVNSAGTSRTSRLDSTTMALVSTGRYRAIYTAAVADTLEQLVWTFSVVEGGLTRTYGNNSLIVDTTAIDFTSADRTLLQSVETRLTAGRAGNLDFLDGSILSRAPSSTALSNATWTDAKAAFIDVSIASRLASASYTVAPTSAAILALFKADTDFDAMFTSTTAAGDIAGFLDTFIESDPDNVGDFRFKASGLAEALATVGAEPTVIPAAAVSVMAKIGLLYALARNKLVTDIDGITLRNNADTADIGSASHSESAGTYTRNKFS